MNGQNEMELSNNLKTNTKYFFGAAMFNEIIGSPIFMDLF